MTRGSGVLLALFLAGCPVRLAGDPYAEAKKSALRGMSVLNVQHDASAAKPLLEEGAAKLEKAGDPFGAALVLANVAEIDHEQDRLISAKKNHERALSLLHRGATTPFHFESVIFLPPVTTPSRSAGAATLLGIAETSVRFAYTGVLIDLGETRAAEVQLRQVTAGASRFGPWFGLLMKERIGDLRRHEWKTAASRESYAAAFAGATRPNSAFDIVAFRANLARKLAEVEMLDGHAGEAMKWNSRASEIIGSSNVPIQIQLALQRASLHFDAGQVGEAEALYVRALQLADSTGNPNERIGVLIEIGATHVFRGQYGSAVATFHEVIGLVQKLKRPEEEASLWNVVALIYVLIESDNAEAALDRGEELAAASELPTARQLIQATRRMRKAMASGTSPREVLDIFSPFGMGEMHGSDMQCAGALPLITGGNHDKGRALLQKCIDTTTSVDLRAMFKAVIGGSYVMQRNASKAIDAFKGAIEELEHASADLNSELRADYLGGQRKLYYAVVIELLAGQGREHEALQYAERARSRSFLQMLANRRINPHRQELATELESLRSRTQEWGRRVSLGLPGAAFARADLDHARARYRELLSRVKMASPEYASMLDAEPPSLDALLHEIPPAATLIEYFVTTTTVHAWVIEGPKIAYVRLAVEPDALHSDVCWALGLGQITGKPRGIDLPDSGCGAQSSAETAYKDLFEPLQSLIHNPRIIIVPHGALHYIPFAALRDPKTHSYLVQDYTITHVPSLAVMRYLLDKESPSHGGALVIGDPAGRKALPAARREAEEIGKELGAEIKLGAEATRLVFHNIHGQFDLIHVGAHGAYDARNPLFTSIELAKTGPDDDGLFTVGEIISDIDLTGVNLVVLSACGSGRGTPTGGDEVVGLARAVHYAGSPHVITTLWDIDDEAAADLMKDFYSSLRGMAAADALRHAQLSMLSREPYRDPSYWAAFTLSGAFSARDKPRPAH